MHCPNTTFSKKWCILQYRCLHVGLTSSQPAEPAKKIATAANDKQMMRYHCTETERLSLSRWQRCTNLFSNVVRSRIAVTSPANERIPEFPDVPATFPENWDNLGPHVQRKSGVRANGLAFDLPIGEATDKTRPPGRCSAPRTNERRSRRHRRLSSPITKTPWPDCHFSVCPFRNAWGTLNETGLILNELRGNLRWQSSVSAAVIAAGGIFAVTWDFPAYFS